MVNILAIPFKCKEQSGVTYLWVLGLLFIASLGIGKSLDIYSKRVQRQKEIELIRVGKLYQKAIRNYYLSSPGRAYQYPKKLELLLKDPRHIVTRRYIRKLYQDPFTGKPFELIISDNGAGIKGVKSSSSRHPINTKEITGLANSTSAGSYQDWLFIANIANGAN